MPIDYEVACPFRSSIKKCIFHRISGDCTVLCEPMKTFQRDTLHHVRDQMADGSHWYQPDERKLIEILRLERQEMKFSFNLLLEGPEI